MGRIASFRTWIRRKRQLNKLAGSMAVIFDANGSVYDVRRS